MMACYKTLISLRLRARDFAAQQTEVAIRVAVQNLLLPVGLALPVNR
ncbi:hypothetical protein PCO85_11660 [Prodigiosinella aquatilis]|nr:hypothetical protein [Prodigiosinella sp. LS101]WJV51929.1 hypothetical protein PCO85_11660 [Prodigiosinella sp. LS101]WJV56285.1 hypothetical protein PCO84_11660 [Pectobacteriaceae bacterium C111]